METNFVDYVKVFCRSGSGGKGSTHFRREKFVERGGPDGGNGGRGGHIIIRSDSNIWTLLHLKYKRHILADNGESGAGALKSGADGKDVYINLPVGSIIKDAFTSEILAELVDDKQEIILFPGGRGGLGNTEFKTSTNRAPRYSQPGEKGVEQEIIIELKLLADVGLVGFPNAGKSTLLSVISAAKPEIADYPFTTLVPNLGVVQYHDYKSFVVADIPGIIEGAAAGKGLGHRFLRHIERNSILLFMVSADSNNIKDEYNILLNELKLYNPELLDKRRILAITKTDLIDDKRKTEIKKEIKTIKNIIFISSVINYNILELKELIWQQLND